MPFDNANLPEVTLTLMAARSYIEEHGWCRTWRRGRRACIVGALYTVTLDRYMPNSRTNPTPANPGHPQVSAALEVLNKALWEQRADNIPVIAWNDIRSTKLKDVFNLFDKAIAASMASK